MDPSLLVRIQFDHILDNYQLIYVLMLDIHINYDLEGNAIINSSFIRVHTWQSNNHSFFAFITKYIYIFRFFLLWCRHDFKKSRMDAKIYLSSSEKKWIAMKINVDFVRV